MHLRPHPPTLTKLAELVLGASSKTESIELFSNGFTTLTSKMKTSRDYLIRAANPPKMQIVTKAYMAGAKIHPRKVLSLSENKFEGLTLLHFIPDTAATLEKKGKDQHKTVAEYAMDESPEKRSKLDTGYTPVDEIEGLTTVTMTSSSFIGFAATWVQFDLADVKKENIPQYVSMLMEMNDLISGPDASEWYQKYKGSVSDVKMAMYLLNCYNNILLVLGKASQDVLQHQTALGEDWIAIDTKPTTTAKRLHEKAIERATEVFEGSISPPECPLWDSSVTKQLEERKETMLLHAKLGVNNRAIAGGGGGATATELITATDANRSKRLSVGGGGTTPNPNKHRKTHNDPDNLGEDGLDGYIVCPQLMGFFKLPDELDAKPGSGLSLCKKFYRKGSRCMFGKKCNRSHKHPKDLPADKQKIFWNWVQTNTDGIKANDELVTAAMLNLRD